ncbi:MAG TPA: phosphoglucomutase [Treponemataceae bacterium]|nr:phosphoglucomutase [Treponemataceae bacterium]
MILSASGWRMVFAQTDNHEDTTTTIGTEKAAISSLIGKTYADFITGKITNLQIPAHIQSSSKPSCIAVGMDSRPTGPVIADSIIHALLKAHIDVAFIGISAAPEIMAYARSLDGFVYISASHNPIGHNGIKFGLNDGGVLSADIALQLSDHFKMLCNAATNESIANLRVSDSLVHKVYSSQPSIKAEALKAYQDFTMQVITGEKDIAAQKKAFEPIATGIQKHKIGIVADMNGSARSLSIDNSFLPTQGIQLYTINNTAGKIAHAIIPEPENLVYCAAEMERLQGKGKTDAVLGYMPDCDGDRGNIVYWDTTKKRARILKAQEVFSLCVLAELAYSSWKNTHATQKKQRAIAVNGPTSMRIDEIAKAFNAIVGRAEVGEAHVVNKARELRKLGYEVPILGEGSNGGNITHPAAVRDPMNTLFALIKLLVIRDEPATAHQAERKGLFHLWCINSNQKPAYKDTFSLTDIIATLPIYATTGVSEPRAILKINTIDHAVLKTRFQNVFENEWNEKKEELAKKYGFHTYTPIASNGTKLTKKIKDYGVSKKGGLKIIFNDKNNQPLAYMWMRGSGTEPVFRVLCDVKAQYQADIPVENNIEWAKKTEKELLRWQTKMLMQADK